MDEAPTKEPTPTRPPPPVDSAFDGNPQDLDRVLGLMTLQFTLFGTAFDEEAKKTAYLLSHFRGAALDWGIRLVSRNDNRLQNYGQFVQGVKTQFGHDPEQLISLARTKLAALKQHGDLQEFLIEFDDLCELTGARSDVSKITMVLGKLSPEYYNCIANAGDVKINYSTLRLQLLNMYAMKQPAKFGDTQRKKSKCGKCGKRGHTADQCKSTN